MRVEERRMIERIIQRLVGLRSALETSNLRREERHLYSGQITETRLELLAMLEDAPHDTP